MTYTLFRGLIFLIIPLVIGCQNRTEPPPQHCDTDLNLDSIIKVYQINTGSLAQIDFNKPLDPQWTTADYLILRKVLEESSPNLYRYTSKETMDSLFEAKLCEMHDSMPYLEFVKHIAQTFNAMACGHSGWSHTSTFFPFRDSQMEFFPLKISLDQDKYFVNQNGSRNSSIPTGVEILSINGRAPDEINRILRSCMYKDGTSAPFAESEIETYFQNAYSNIIANPDTFNLKLRDKQGHITTVSLPAMSKKEIDSILMILYPTEPDVHLEKPLVFKFDSTTTTAIYTIHSFRNELIQHHHQNFNHFTDSVFNSLRLNNTKNLIIDLRGNTGGWTANGKKLFSFFIDKPTSYIQSVEFNAVDTFSFQPLVVSDRGIHDSMHFELNDHGLYEWVNYPSLKVHPDLENHFDGKVYILIDDMSRSCSGIFSAMMRAHTKAIFMGDENGSAQCGSGGMVISVRLPYTGITIRSSTAKYTTNSAGEQSGIQVDYPLDITAQTKDSSIQYIINMISDSSASDNP